MSPVYYSRIAKLAEAIVEPSGLALSFQVNGIIGPDVQRDIVDRNNGTAHERTLKLLNAVGKHLSAFPDKMETVVRVLFDYQMTKRIALDMAKDANLPDPGKLHPKEQSHPGTASIETRQIHHIGTKVKPIHIAFIVLPVVAAILLAAWHSLTPVTCSWPKATSENTRLQTRQGKVVLGIKKLSDELGNMQVEVGNALSAGHKCEDIALLGKMELVDVAVRKVKEKGLDAVIFLREGAAKALTDLQVTWNFAVDGKVVMAIRQLDEVCKTAEGLASQISTLKGYVHNRAGEIQSAIDNLIEYQKDEKADHEWRLHELKEEKERYWEKIQVAEATAKEFEVKARECELNAQKEMEAWEEFKDNRGSGIVEIEDKWLNIERHKPYEKRRDNFLKDQRYHLGKADESKQVADQNQVMFSEVEERIKAEKFHLKCVNDAIIKMKVAIRRFEMTTLSSSLFDLRDLSKDCKDLSDEIELICSYCLPSTKVATLSQVCDKAMNLFAKLQALVVTISE